jgi:NADH-quinone oxidoreductase subunit L
LLPDQPGAAGAPADSRPALHAAGQQVLLHKFNDWFFAGGAREVGHIASSVGDRRVTTASSSTLAKAVGWAALLMRRIQTGYVYQYAFTMIVGVVALLTLWVVRWL